MVFGFGIFIYIMLRFTLFEDKTINTIMPGSEIKINAGKESVLGYHLKKGDQSMHYPIFAPLPQIKRHSIVFYNMPSWMTLELTVLDLNQMSQS